MLPKMLAFHASNELQTNSRVLLGRDTSFPIAKKTVTTHKLNNVP